MGTPSCEVHHFHIVLRGSFAVRMDDGQEVEFVAGDVCDIPPGHDAWVVGDEIAEILDIAGNVAEFGTPALHTGTVVTLLMTDIVGSTDLADRVGDPAWRQVLERHNRIVRAQLDRFRGMEIATTGDGFLATFSSALAALHAARAITAEVLACGVQVRIGASRALPSMRPRGSWPWAGPPRWSCPTSCAPLSAGGPFEFDPLGEVRLKGIAAPWELFRLR